MNNPPKKQKTWRSLQHAALGILVVPLVGLILDATSGFYILRHSQSIYGICIGLVMFAALYLLGEVGATWINSKDKASHPLYLRISHIFLLLMYIFFIAALVWIAFKYIGIITI